MTGFIRTTPIKIGFSALVAGLVFLGSAGSARADWFYTLVSYKCDRDLDSVILTYRGGFDDAGLALIATKGPNSWEPNGLIATMADSDHIGTITHVRRTCHLSDGDYHVAIEPAPGNLDITGHCGAWITATAEVRVDDDVVYKKRRFENDCDNFTDPVITKVVIKAGAAPIITKTPFKDFYK